MFTGIIEKVSEVRGITKSSGKAVVQAGISGYKDLVIGESIAINGICLTLTKVEGDTGHFDASAETLRMTTMGEWKPGRKANMERALIAGVSRLGGHYVSGHVDGIGKVSGIKQSQEYLVLDIQIGRELLSGIVLKGSVAIDGVSLTVSGIKGDIISIHIIPETVRSTTIRHLKPGSAVNIETDMLLKKPVQESKLTMNKIKALGW